MSWAERKAKWACGATRPLEIRILDFFLVVYKMAAEGPGRSLKAGTMRRNVLNGKTIGFTVVLVPRSWCLSVGRHTL
ncbi:hypothetical protein AU099_gp02 [Gordonia phage GTE8]|uniref:Uncharacterized protein n=1 Tax=Gordonia phage GTE8 TaxID=1647475 RepID=A0A0K0N685_9CAUD|nr:hypothetical protein AU099_gp02 [Gordonia phage GTE8]AKJ72345.1 hypothetical protein GTE8_2 [Gordonia phage GTE8]